MEQVNTVVTSLFIDSSNGGADKGPGGKVAQAANEGRCLRLPDISAVVTRHHTRQKDVYILLWSSAMLLSVDPAVHLRHYRVSWR